MIYGIVALGVVCLLQQVGAILLFRWSIQERQRLLAAMLQRENETAAAERMVQPSPKDMRKMVEARDKFRKEMMERGGTFSSTNPFGHIPVKPDGV